ncbi:MAG: NAD(P)-binding domain-containing protein [Bacteroidota bacterium]
MSTTCVIGAGSSGIVACKVLHERGLPFDCYEISSGIGGNWRYENDNEMSSAYQSLHINTSRTRMAYSDFPMPDAYPDFPHHSQIARYFEDYVDHFGFRDQIQFRAKVAHVEPAEEGGYDVTIEHLDSGTTETKRYDAVLVANGHHWDPNWPEFPGTFGGEVLHSHDYKVPGPYAGKRVVIVGVGNSGTDIASELSRNAERVMLSSRSGAHIVPKYILGRPLDHWNTEQISRLPFPMQRLLFSALLRLSRGKQESYGFPTPSHPFGSEHPTVSNELLNLIGHGRIIPKPNIARLDADRVVFTDGTEEEADVLIYATGYKVSFPFFDAHFLSAENNELPLYGRVVDPERPSLYFIGLIQPLGAIMPLAEVQSEWVADLLEGKATLPRPAAMRQAIARDEAKMTKRYVKSKRHTMQVDFFDYARQVERLRKR